MDRPGTHSRKVDAGRDSGSRLSARERISLLLDDESFIEIDAFVRHRSAAYGMDRRRPLGDGVIVGYGTVDGRQVCVFSQDAAVFGGSMGEACGEKIAKVMDLALRVGCPIIGINDSAGARIQEGVAALAQYAEIARRNVQASGVLPQISLIMGPCAGGAAYSPALTDITVMVDGTSHMFVTGPDVIRAVTGEQTTLEELGGGRASAAFGGAHYLAENERDAIAFVQDLLAFLPSNNCESPPVEEIIGGPLGPADRALDALVPEDPARGYDMYRLVECIADDGDLLEIHGRFAPNIICGFIRVDGHPVGTVANQPLHLAGALDIDACEKAGRFVRLCDAFGIPLLTLVDVPGYLAGVQQERDGILRRGAKLLYAYAEATVPQVTLVVRKAYGGGYAAMGSKHLGADINLAWPSARIAVMGAEGAVNILHRKELAASTDPASLREGLVKAYQDTFASPYQAAERGYIDIVLQPSETRPQVARALRALRTKRMQPPLRRHGNIPL
ncbi:acyl-CoA carboxylase subunit beta [Streptomyces fildesensis]|uniref:Acyl-CoA carboxylase subunit beta n=1 Tax=Streptomyces fildesensis TaxID=375757 RepID=A0ABW8C3D8_9ACTN